VRLFLILINSGLDIGFGIEDLREDSKDENSYTGKGVTKMLQLLIAKVGYIAPPPKKRI
jgi:hypothetical protein